jgi:serine/threonine protein phosphatase PrpC
MEIEHAACSFAGRRNYNEDSYLDKAELGLFVVADGVGGYEGGEVASKLVVGQLDEFYQRYVSDPEGTWPFKADPARSLAENALNVAIQAAHASIESHRTDRLARMASTIAALHLSGKVAVIGHCGDSRVYRLRDGVIEQLTHDHSLYAQLKASGARDVPPPDQYPFKNVVTRVLGSEQHQADIRSEPLQAGDAFVLCSDGLVESVDDATLAEVLRSLLPKAAAPRLVREAYDRGSRDNITAVVVRVG